VLAKLLPCEEFIFRSLYRLRWTERQAEPFCGKRSDVGRPIAYGGDSVKRSAPDDLLDSFFGCVEAQRDGVVAPGIVEDVAAIRGEHQLKADPLRDLRKCARLITGGRGYEQNAHSSIFNG